MCSYIVDKMVSGNVSEAEVCAEAYRGIKNNRETTTSTGNYTGYSSARMMSLQVKDRNRSDISGLIERIASAKQQIANDGFTLTTVEPTYIYYISVAPNDPYYGWQWAYPRSQAELGWDIEKGSHAIKVGLVDTCVDPDHPDLVNNIDTALGYDFVDIDMSAYKSAHYTLINGEDYKQMDSLPNDYNGHGTHCAGILAA